MSFTSGSWYDTMGLEMVSLFLAYHSEQAWKLKSFQLHCGLFSMNFNISEYLSSNLDSFKEK